MSLQPWQRHARQTVHQDRWIHLLADDCVTASGVRIAPYYVLAESPWVHVVLRDSAGRVLTVRQYRHGAEAMVEELPGGISEPGEDLLFAAQRELREETGYTATKWEHMIAPWANPARQTNQVHVFLAHQPNKVADPKWDANEEMEVQWRTPEALLATIKSGEFGQAMHVGLVLACLAFDRSFPASTASLPHHG